MRAEIRPGPRPVADDLFTGYPEAPQLVGSACAACGGVAFPAQGSCPRCTGQETAPVPLPTTGRIWGFTIQRFQPKEPFVAAGGPFTPYGVGYVDLGDVLVEARLLAADLATFEVGLEVQLVLEALTVAATGDVVVGFAFAPVAEAAGIGWSPGDATATRSPVAPPGLPSTPTGGAS